MEAKAPAYWDRRGVATHGVEYRQVGATLARALGPKVDKDSIDACRFQS